MSSKRSDGGPDESTEGSWATETLPLSVRRELLARELRKLGFGGAVADRSPADATEQAQPHAGGAPHDP